MTNRDRTRLPLDILLAALETELIVATEAEIAEAAEDAGVCSVAIDEVQAVLASAYGREVDDGDLPLEPIGKAQGLRP